MAVFRILYLAACICALSVDAATKLQEQLAWRQVDYAWPTPQDREVALRSGQYAPEANLPVGIEAWGDKLFISVPRWSEGIPSTLNYVPRGSVGSEPLRPYPNWNQASRSPDCDSLTTVYRMKVDKCDRLWVLDTGTVGIGNTTTNPCPYSINVFDLHSDTKILRYVLPAETIVPTTFIANLALEIDDNDCSKTHAYASDELGYGLIVFSLQRMQAWRIEHGYFMPDPLRGDFHIGGLNFQWSTEGIFGLSLSPPMINGERNLFFSPLASYRHFMVNTKYLKDPNLADKIYHQFAPLPERGSHSHVTSTIVHEPTGIMLYNLIDQNGVGCWNVKQPFLPKNQALLDQDNEGLIFPSDIIVDREDIVWVISDRMPVFLEAELDPKDVNFRIYAAHLRDLIAGSVCEKDTNTLTINELNYPLIGGTSPIQNFNSFINSF